MDFLPILIGRELGINTDIFETNVINIAILVFGLFNFIGGILTTSMEERKQKIVEDVQASENRINEARLRFEEAKKQLEQVDVIVNQIKSDTASIKDKILATEFSQANSLITKQFSSAYQIVDERKDFITYYVLCQVLQLTLFQSTRLSLRSSSIKGQQQKYLNDSVHLLVCQGGKF
jgi:F0F1-type ATP synthase membrane subunit b/b'